MPTEEDRYKSAMSIGALEASIRHHDASIAEVKTLIRDGFEDAREERNAQSKQQEDRVSKLRDDFKAEFNALGSAVIRAAGVADRVDDVEITIEKHEIRLSKIETIIAGKTAVKSAIQAGWMMIAAAAGAVAAIWKMAGDKLSN